MVAFRFHLSKLYLFVSGTRDRQEAGSLVDGEYPECTGVYMSGVKQRYME